MELYINSAGIISAAGNNIGDGQLNAHDYIATALHSADADYKAYIPVMQLRRMSKAVRMGVVASKVALQQAGIDKPNAITVGTAYGCLQDTERFLDKLVDQDEQMLTPTAFIQSTHNTVSGQIALLAKCNGHNLTYVHKGHSFEHALIDAQLYLGNNPDANVLVGGIDELTENSIKALQLSGLATQQNLTNTDILNGGNEGTVIGEGAAFFSVTKHPLTNKYIKVKALNIFKESNEDAALNKIETFVSAAKRPDLVLLGNNGNKTSSSFYSKLSEKVLQNTSAKTFKHLSGEYPTASSFALGMLFEYVRTGKAVLEMPEQPKNVLLVNNFKKYYSFWDLELSI